MEQQLEIKYNIFTIQEIIQKNFRAPLIAIETNQIIKIFQLVKNNNQIHQIHLKTCDGEIMAQDNETNLAFSYNCFYFAYSNKQSINIYQITSPQIVKLATINIDFEVKKIELAETGMICILSQGRLILYNLFQIHKITNSIEIQENKFKKKFKSLKLNYNDKLLALQSENMIDFQDLSEIDSNNAYKGSLKADMFSTSIDNKTFAILNGTTIEFYDFDLKKNLKPSHILEIENEQNLLKIQFIEDPNSILVIYPDNIQIWNHKSKKKEMSIEGFYDYRTQVSINTDVAVIEQSELKIQINKNVKSRNTNQQKQILPNKDEYRFYANCPQFTSDGQNIVFQKISVGIMFQSLQDPKLKYTYKLCNGQQFRKFLPQSNLLITNDRNFYYFWDASILDNINLLHKTLNRNHQIFFFKQLLIFRQNFIRVWCIQNLKDIINNSYDNILDTGSFGIGYVLMKLNIIKQIIIRSQYGIQKKEQDLQRRTSQGILEILRQLTLPKMKNICGLIIVWNMLNHQNIKISHGVIDFKEDYSCNFVKIQDSLGITCEIQNEIVIFDLKDFKSYEIYHIIPKQYNIIRYYVFSKGNKLAILQKNEAENKRIQISIFKVDTKEIIENINISDLQIEEYFIKDIEKEYRKDVITQEYIKYGITLDTNRFWMYNVNLELLEIHNFNSSSGAPPIYKIYVPFDFFRGNIISVGNKYLTYCYYDQFRIIDLELYKQQVYVFVLDKDLRLYGQLPDDTLILLKVDNQHWYPKSYHLFNYKSDQQQIQTLFEKDCNRFILAFSNDGQQCAQGWDDGDIIIFKVQNDKKWSKYDCWNSKQIRIKHLKFIQNDEILISSQDNELSFWNMKKETIQERRLIQQIKIDFDIENIVVSPNGYISLQLKGGIILILTNDQSKCNIENENYKKQYFGCYRSFPKLEQIQTKNCIIQNSIIENQDDESILHLFSNQEMKEFESGFNNEETQE
ncbi:unnamed protein product [Paramecium sonneborni]|uniref:WD40-repeat-containing domain n=1 Tax=Paramecium sonneborni TaxID=65129 RepID=A0A8S1RDR8_9CILI|nr:unnamed protein product [Paramecium sonneborni]